MRIDARGCFIRKFIIAKMPGSRFSTCSICSLLIIALGWSVTVLRTFAGESGSSQAQPFAPKKIQAGGIENFFQLSDALFSGAAPEGDEGFAELQNRGIKTIITVDGAKPDVKRAKKFGMRYVHLPIGYDRVPTDQAKRLIKAAQTLPKPIFVHCHHGMHRGPAGAAVICEGLENWTSQQAIEWLKMAGTSTNYAGLYKSVEEFRVPSSEELKKVSAEFSESVEVSRLVDSMVEIDLRHDNLKLIKTAQFQTPVSYPDLDPAHEALLLEELFKELNRSTEIRKRPEDFQAQMAKAERAVTDFRKAMEKTTFPLSDSQRENLSAAFSKVTRSCGECHTAHRN